MYDCIKVATRRLFYVMVLLSFPFTGQLTLQFNLYELAEVETLHERLEFQQTGSVSNWKRRPSKSVKSESATSHNPAVQLTRMQHRVKRHYEGHRLFTGDVAPQLC